jgi:PKD repeat protein
MKLHSLLFVCSVGLIVSCKKDKDAETAPSISFTNTSGYKTTLPVNIIFTASAPSADNVTWDFGDGTTGQGLTVNHSYTSFGGYKVKATATKSGLSSSYSKDIPITFYRRAVIKRIDVLQTPTLKPGGLDWDPGTFPDLAYDIVFPGDTTYVSGTVLNNAETGSFNVIPSQRTFIFNEDIKFNIYDKDVGNVPDKELMGTVRFKFTSVIPDTTVYVDSVQVNSGALRLMLKFEFQQ